MEGEGKKEGGEGLSRLLVPILNQSNIQDGDLNTIDQSVLNIIGCSDAQNACTAG